MKLFNTLLDMANEANITITRVNGDGCWHSNGYINLDKVELKEFANSLGLPLSEVAAYVLAHELGHAFNHSALGPAYGKDELLAWLTAKELCFPDGEEPSSFELLARVCLESYGVDLNAMTFNPERTSAFCPVPWALATGTLTRV